MVGLLSAFLCSSGRARLHVMGGWPRPHLYAYISPVGLCSESRVTGTSGPVWYTITKAFISTCMTRLVGRGDTPLAIDRACVIFVAIMLKIESGII